MISSTSARCSATTKKMRPRRTRDFACRTKNRRATRNRISRRCSPASSRASTRTSTKPTSSRITISAWRSRRWGCSTRPSRNCRKRYARRKENCGPPKCWASAFLRKAHTGSPNRSCGAVSICRRPAIRSGSGFSTGSVARSNSRAKRPTRGISMGACLRSTSVFSMRSSA